MIELLHGDCMDYLKTLPDKAFDLAIVDPPYGIDFAKRHTGNGWTVRESKGWDKFPPSQEYFAELNRVSVNRIIWGGQHMACPSNKPSSKRTRCVKI